MNHNDYIYQQEQGYQMALRELKPLLEDCLKIINKPCKTRDRITDYLVQNPKATWQEIVSNCELSSNGLVAHHLPRIKLIKKIKRFLNV